MSSGTSVEPGGNPARKHVFFDNFSCGHNISLSLDVTLDLLAMEARVNISFLMSRYINSDLDGAGQVLSLGV